MSTLPLSVERMREIVKGRLAFALVSARAERCPDRRCARRRQCLATAKIPSKWSEPLGDCRNMSEAEWRCVSFGIRMNHQCVIMPVFVAEMKEKQERDAKLSREEYRRRYQPLSPEARAREAAERDREPRADMWPDYAWLLWVRVIDGVFFMPRDLAGAGAGLVGWLARRGCRCAEARRMGECDSDWDVFRVKGELRKCPALTDPAAGFAVVSAKVEGRVAGGAKRR